MAMRRRSPVACRLSLYEARRAPINVVSAADEYSIAVSHCHWASSTTTTTIV
jgi:hypothetical protein